jgi:hypothetical protein
MNSEEMSKLLIVNEGGKVGGDPEGWENGNRRQINFVTVELFGSSGG